MANENVPALAPTRSDDQILPFAAAFTASASVLAIYIQQFWNTLTYVEKAGTYRFQLDEDWLTLDAHLLREALEITPIDQTHLFVSPPSGDAIMNFMNDLGYPEVVHFVSSMAVNHLSASPFHLAEEDLRLGNLKFVSKGEIDEVFGMPIPNKLISNNIRNESYYNAYLEMVAKHDQKVAAKKEGKKKSASSKQPRVRSGCASKRAEVKQTSTCTKIKGVAIQEPVAEAIRPLPVVEGKGKAIITEELGEDVEKQVDLEEKTAELGQDQAGSDPGETHESRPPPAQVLIDEDQAGPDPGISRVALARPDPEPTHDEFMTDLYPKVQESLKFPADEHVLLEDPLSSTGTLSSMKNLEDAYAIGDQFINDKSTDDEPGKLNVEAEVVSMVTVPIYQASSSVPPLSTPVIDLSPPKPASSTTQTPIFTATTTTTPLPPPPQQQSTTESELAERVVALEKKLSDLEQTNKNLDNTTRNLGSRVYTLELRDLPYKINEAVCENVKEAVQIALQAPLQDRFRDLPEEDMKEMLHQRMFESGTYKSLPEHIALYEALEASMARAQRDEFLTKKDKSRKRCHDDQDPLPPPPNSDLSKRRRHNTGASGSS
ncbi:hypothetical protein Tco_1020570 [Tanacetum coccineum]